MVTQRARTLMRSLSGQASKTPLYTASSYKLQLPWVFFKLNTISVFIKYTSVVVGSRTLCGLRMLKPLAV